MPIPAIVGAAIITGAAGTAATVYGSNRAGAANKQALAAEERGLDKNLAANREALAYEKEIEDRRRLEWDTEQDDERAQWEWYQNALAPYRDASVGALGSLGQMVERLGGGRIAAPSQIAPAGTPAQSSAPPAGWSPSDMVRQASAVAGGATQRGAAPSRVGMTAAAPSFSRMPVGDPGTDVLNVAGQIADLIKNLPQARQGDVSRGYAHV